MVLLFVLGVLFVLGEEAKTGLQQCLEFGVLRRGEQQGAERTVDAFVVGDFIVDVGLVEGGAVKLVEFRQLVRCGFAQPGSSGCPPA